MNKILGVLFAGLATLAAPARAEENPVVVDAPAGLAAPQEYIEWLMCPAPSC